MLEVRYTGIGRNGCVGIEDLSWAKTTNKANMYNKKNLSHPFWLILQNSGQFHQRTTQDNWLFFVYVQCCKHMHKSIYQE